MTIKTKLIASLLCAAALFGAAPASAQDHGSTPPFDQQTWSFAGPFGTYDVTQLQRGFQVYREVCSSCHGARLIAFRNLSEDGGPGFSEDQVKALAAQYTITDPEAAAGTRPGVAADRWPSPFANEQEARDANGGALPPDFSVLAKARGITQPFPFWIFNYFTAYSEGGADYVYNLLHGYHEEAPEGFELAEGKYYNDYFPGHAIGMAPPLADGLVDYPEGVPETLDQYSKDVAAFMYWMADPHLVARKETGFRVILFLVVLAGLLWFVKRRIWRNVEH